MKKQPEKDPSCDSSNRKHMSEDCGTYSIALDTEEFNYKIQNYDNGNLISVFLWKKVETKEKSQSKRESYL